MENNEIVMTKDEVVFNLENEKIEILKGIKSVLTIIAIFSIISTIILILLVTHTISILVY